MLLYRDLVFPPLHKKYVPGEGEGRGGGGGGGERGEGHESTFWQYSL